MGAGKAAGEQIAEEELVLRSLNETKSEETAVANVDADISSSAIETQEVNEDDCKQTEDRGASSDDVVEETIIFM